MQIYVHNSSQMVVCIILTFIIIIYLRNKLAPCHSSQNSSSSMLACKKYWVLLPLFGDPTVIKLWIDVPGKNFSRTVPEATWIQSTYTWNSSIGLAGSSYHVTTTWAHFCIDIWNSLLYQCDFVFTTARWWVDFWRRANPYEDAVCPLLDR